MVYKTTNLNSFDVDMLLMLAHVEKGPTDFCKYQNGNEMVSTSD